MRKLFYLFLCLGIFCQLSAQNLLWVEHFRGSGANVFTNMTSDSEGNVYVTGFFGGTAIFGSDIYQTEITANGFYDVFISKTAPNGNLLWVRHFGSAYNGQFDQATGDGVAVDNKGFVYLTGTFDNSINLNPEGEPFILTPHLEPDVQDSFILKLDSDGEFVWAKGLGGGSLTKIASLGVDEERNVYVSGFFDGTLDFSHAGSDIQFPSLGGNDGIVAKFNESGDFIWARQYGGNHEDVPINMKTLPNGELYIVGTFKGDSDLNPNPIEEYILNTDHTAAFLLQLDSNGSFVKAVKVADANNAIINNEERVGLAQNWGIDVDQIGNIYISGNMAGEVKFAPNLEGDIMSLITNESGYITKFNSNGILVWMRHLSTIEVDGASHAINLMLDDNANILVTGNFYKATNFGQILLDGLHLNYVTKLSNEGEFIFANSFGKSESFNNIGIAKGIANDTYLSGIFWEDVNISPDPNNPYEISSWGLADIYLIKISTDNLSTKDIYTENKISVYPNPFNSELTISNQNDMAGKNYSVYDLSGRIIASGMINFSTKINLNQLPKGTYILKIDGKHSFKVIKK